MQISAHALELVLLRPDPEDNMAACHTVADRSAQHSTTFAYLVIRLPTDCSAGAVSVTCAGSEQPCKLAEDRFGAAYAAVFSDCGLEMTCKPQAHALFVVYALRVPEVRTTMRCASSTLDDGIAMVVTSSALAT